MIIMLTNDNTYDDNSDDDNDGSEQDKKLKEI